MAASAISERDLAVLRSFADRIDPSDAGAHNNIGVLYYQKRLIPEAIAFSIIEGNRNRSASRAPKPTLLRSNMGLQ